MNILKTFGENWSLTWSASFAKSGVESFYFAIVEHIYKFVISPDCVAYIANDASI